MTTLDPFPHDARIEAEAEAIQSLIASGDDSLARQAAVTLLEDSLEALRAEAGIQADPQPTRSGMLGDLSRCFATGNLDLEALALIRARHVSPVQLTVREVAETVSLGERSLRRRQKRGFQYLARRAAEGRAGITSPHETNGSAATTRGDVDLPLPGDRFVGRDAELETILDRLEQDRVLTLWGPAGIGKSRLAMEAARRIHLRCGSPVWFLPLEHLDSPDLIAPALAAVLRASGIEHELEGEDPVVWLAQARGLLVLDRCEHLIADCAVLIDRLEHEAPGLWLLITSRRPVEAGRDRLLPIEALELPTLDEVGDGAILERRAASQLFLERLRTKRPDFRLDDTSAEQIAILVRRLEGLPLAIEIAAARASLLPLETVAWRMARRIARDARESNPRPETPESIQRAIEGGLTDLSAREHRLLAGLSVFAGGFELRSVQAVCGPQERAASETETEVVDAALARDLGSLVQRSLVVRMKSGGGRRHRMLESLRAYATDMLLRAGLQEHLARRHAEYFAWLAARSSEALSGSQVGPWMRRLALEHDNLQTAFAWALSWDPPLALRIACGLSRYRIVSGQLSAGRKAIEQALSACRESELAIAFDEELEALSSAGAMARQQSEFTVARDWLEEALALARRQGEPESLATTLRRLGNVVEEMGRRERARDLYREAAELSRDSGDARGLASALNNLGILAEHEGRPAEAATMLQEALELAEQTQATWLEGVLRGNLGISFSSLGRYEEARDAFLGSLETARALSDRLGIGSLLTLLAIMDLKLGHVESVRDRLREALPHLDDLAERQKAGEWLDTCAGLLLRLGDARLAAVTLGAADGIRERWEIEILPKALSVWRQLETSLVEALGADAVAALRREGASRPWQAVASQAIRRVDHLTRDSFDAADSGLETA